jgi:hypothetical protein
MLSAVRRFGCEFQFSVHLIQQFFGLLRVAVQVPFISLLRGGNPLPSLHAQSLRGGEIRMAASRYVPFRRLSDGNGSDEQRATEDYGEESVFDHGSYSLCVKATCGNRKNIGIIAPQGLRYNWNLPDSYILKGV